MIDILSNIISVVFHRFSELSTKQRLWVLGVLTAVTTFAPVISWVRHAEIASVDFRQRHFGLQASASGQVVVVEIDEQSLKLLEEGYGRWPLPRRVYKELLSFIAMGEPKAVLFDVLFTGRSHPEDDQWLGEISEQLGYVSHAINLLQDPSLVDQDRLLPENVRQKAALNSTRYLLQPSRKQDFRDWTGPAPPIEKGASHLHVVTFPADYDGVLRQAPMVFSYSNQLLPSLALKGFLLAFPNTQLTFLKGEMVTQDASRVRRYPLSREGNLRIAYYPIHRGPKSVPLAPILGSLQKIQSGNLEDPSDLTVHPDEFRDKIVVVGASAVALNDLKPTPIHPAYPGAMVQATAISNLIEHHTLRAPTPLIDWMLTLFVLFLSAVAASTPQRLGPKILAPTAGLLLYTYACAIFFSWGWVLPFVVPVGAGIAALLTETVLTLFKERADKLKMRSTLDKYLAPAVVDQMVRSGSNPQAEVGQKLRLSVLFTDIRDFTSLSEQSPPDVVVHQLNQYLERMTEIIFSELGTLDKFIGDAIMAFWGAPIENENHALDAVKCALRMREALTALPQQGAIPFRTGIGIHTGEAIVGNIGSSRRLDYTVIGDTVNLASRLEGLTKDYSVGLLISESCYREVERSVLCRFVDEVQVKGKKIRVRVYEPLALKSPELSASLCAWVEHYQQAMKFFDEGCYEEAARIFTTLAEQGDGPSCVYLKRCRERQQLSLAG